MTRREEHVAAIEAVKAQIKTAGPCHRRDLIRQLHRMKKELLIYDRYRQASFSGERTAVAERPTAV